MKWLNRFFGKEEIPSSVAFAEIDTWLETVSESLFRGLSTKADRLYEELSAAREKLKQDIAELRNAESTEEVPDRIAKIGLLSRDKMVKHLYSMAEKITIPTQTDYKTVSAFYSETTASLEFPFGKSSTNIYCVRSLFPDGISEIIADLNRLRTLLDQLITPLKDKEGQIKHLEHVSEIVGDIKALESEIEAEKENVGDQEEECSACEKSIETDKKRLHAIEEDAEWLRFKELEAELSSLKEELQALDSNIRNMFAPLNKALHLLKKQDETGRHTLSTEERGAVSSILSSPIRALGEDIHENLRCIRSTIEEDPTILKDRKRETTLKWLDNLLNAELSSLKGKRDQLQSRIEECKSKLSDLAIIKDKKAIEQSLVSAQEQLIQVQEGIARSKGRIASLEEAMREKKQRLLEALEGITGKEIDITFASSSASDR